MSDGPSSPRSSVNVHRSKTSRRPYLSLDPVEFSLTDGTSIPPPPPEEATNLGSPGSPGREERINQMKQINTNLSANGPLSSHPVTPIEAPNGADKGSFPLNRQPSNSFGSSQANGQAGRVTSPQGTHTPARGSTPTAASPLSHHQHNGLPQPADALSPADSEESHRQNPPHPQQIGRGRRPSFAQRFLRLRSISSLRGRNASSTSVSQSQHVHNDGTQFVDDPSQPGLHSLGRVTKRPASPSIAGLFWSTEEAGADSMDQPGNRGSQSFPRMMRKKSMELLGTARRKSGMWSGRQDLMSEELEREKMRDSETDSRSNHGMNGRRSTVSSDMNEPPREPAPTLPELNTVREMDGESMFSTIGRV